MKKIFVSLMLFSGPVFTAPGDYECYAFWVGQPQQMSIPDVEIIQSKDVYYVNAKIGGGSVLMTNVSTAYKDGNVPTNGFNAWWYQWPVNSTSINGITVVPTGRGLNSVAGAVSGYITRKGKHTDNQYGRYCPGLGSAFTFNSSSDIFELQLNIDREKAKPGQYFIPLNVTVGLEENKSRGSSNMYFQYATLMRDFPPLTSGGVSVHLKNACSFSVTELNFDFGSFRKDQAKGKILEKKMSLNCSYNGDARVSMQGNNTLDCGGGKCEVTVKVNGSSSLNKTVHLSKDNEVEVSVALNETENMIAGAFSASTVLVVELV